MPAYAAPAIAILVFAVILVLTMVKSVPQGENWTVERFGRYTRTLDPGLRFLVPLVDRVGSRINMMETVLDIDEQEVISRDNAMVVADAVAFYQVVDASKAAYEVRNLEQALKNISQTNIRAVLGSMDLDEALSNRDAINLRLLARDRQRLLALGRQGDPRRDPRPGAAARHHRGDGPADEGRARQARRDPAGRGPEAVGDPQGRGRARGADPRGRGPPRRPPSSTPRPASGSAEAEAKATTMVSQAIAAGDIQAINYFVAQKYTEALRDIAASPNAKTVMVPLEAASLIGSVAGIAELARAAQREG